MRVLAISNLFPPYVQGGNELRLREILEHLRKRHDVQVLTSVLPDSLTSTREPWIRRDLVQAVPYPEPLGKHTFFLGREFATSSLNYATARRVIAEFKPDVAYISDTKRTFLGPAHAAHQAGVPLVWDITDLSLASYLRRSSVRRWVPWSHLDDLPFQHSIAISRYIRDALVKAEVLPPGARFERQGVDLQRFYPDLSPAPADRDRLRLLWVGSLIPDKGLHVVLQALLRVVKNLSGSSRQVHLTICGDSGDRDYKMRLRSFIRNNGLHDSVTLRGRVAPDQIAQLHREHDAYIFSSLWPEPFATTPLEAMACGCAVIGTAVGGQADFFRHDHNCITYEPTSPADLAEKIQVLFDPQRRRRLADTALREVERDFDLRDYVRRIESVLLSAASPQPPRHLSRQRSAEAAPDSV